jgi:hypothetical protein
VTPPYGSLGEARIWLVSPHQSRLESRASFPLRGKPRTGVLPFGGLLRFFQNLAMTRETRACPYCLAVDGGEYDGIQYYKILQFNITKYYKKNYYNIKNYKK